MKTICIAGGTGLIGDRMIEMWSSKYKINILTRQKIPNKPNVTYFEWDIYKGTMDVAALDCDYLINLNGAGIADKRWTAARKKLLIDSRVKSNETLATHLMASHKKPKVFIGASAIGIYGDRGDEILTKDSPIGNEGFMVDCCLAWENSAQLIKPFVDHFYIARIGVVMTLKGGALPEMLITKPFGFMTYFGNGKQYMSTIAIDDLITMFEDKLKGVDQNGVFNAVGEHPITSKDMAKQLAKEYKLLPFVIPAPSFVLRLMLGEMANVVLNSNRVHGNY